MSDFPRCVSGAGFATLKSLPGTSLLGSESALYDGIVVTKNPGLSPEFHCPKGAGDPRRPAGRTFRTAWRPGRRATWRSPWSGSAPTAVTQKIALHLDRFVAFFIESYGHDRISHLPAPRRPGLAAGAGRRRAWRRRRSTTTSPRSRPSPPGSPPRRRRVFPVGDPAKGIRELGLPPLEPRALTPAQVRSLKNLCDRLERFHRLKGQRWAKDDRRGAGPRPRPALARPGDRLRVPLDRACAARSCSTSTWTSSCRNTRGGVAAGAAGPDDRGARARAAPSGRSSSRPMPARRWPTIWRRNGPATPARRRRRSS